MHNLHFLDITAIGLYFAALIWVGYRVMRAENASGESESFMAADRDMNLFQTTATTAATDIGGGFSIAMGGLKAVIYTDVFQMVILPIGVVRVMTIVLGVLAIGMAYLTLIVLELILYAYTFGAAGLFFPMLGLLFRERATARGAFWSMMLGGSGAVVWTLAGEPWGFSSSYAGWVLSLPSLVIISLLTSHSAEEDTGMFAH